MSREEVYSRARAASRAWRRLRPRKQIFGMSHQEFAEMVERSTAARATVEERDRLAREAREERNAADDALRKMLRRVVYAIKGDPTEGEDSELLFAMGYKTQTVKASLISAGRRRASGGVLQEETDDPLPEEDA